MPTIARRSSSRSSSSSAALELGEQASRAASLSPRSRAANASSPTPWRASRTRAAMPSAAKSPGVARDRFQRLVLGAALEAAPGEGDGDVGSARLQLGRLAQGELVAFLEQLVGGGGQQGVEEALDLGPGHGADELVDHLAVAECLDGRDPLHLEAGPQRWFASTSTLASRTRPPRAASAASRAGVSVRQGPHHSAQKSTTTGVLRESSTTSRSKVASVTSTGIGPD